jgi:hypothetical protein
MRFLLLLAAVVLVGCTEENTGPLADGPSQGDTGPAGDVGVQSDTVAPGDNGVTGDIGPGADTLQGDGGLTCDPTFGQADACGGNLVGKWSYTTGCVADSAYDALKDNCPGVQISNVAISFTAASAITFYANGGLLQVFNGNITGKALFPQSCVKLGCNALQGVLKLAVGLKNPGSDVTCVAAGTGCDCDFNLKLVNFGGAKYTVSGGEVTVTGAGGGQWTYYYCVSGNELRYRGTDQNDDHHVTYVLVAAP